ncbi:MAG: hypothetical protein OEV94_12095 [Deltaproteobacteria bacterium]|nr:hypothetical protein [Deltaproteobacteria bacterium]
MGKPGPGRPKGGGKTPGSGRKAGGLNKSTTALRAALHAAGMRDGESPAVWLFQVYSGKTKFKQWVGNGDNMRQVTDTAPLQVRVQAAVACAKYVHPALGAIQVVDDEGRAITPTMVDFTSLVNRIKGSA